MQRLRYIAYVRKSEERKERQELSHKAQIDKIKEYFPDLNIVKWLEPESKSAFTPGRPIFEEMLRIVDEGKADGIVSWHPNRLSRNEIDSAKLTFMLRGKLKDLKFCSYNFDNSAEGIMMLQMVMNQSQYESSKQGRDVKRGMEAKANDGERPGQVPIGYKKVPVLDENGNASLRKDKIVTKTDIDPDYFELVKKIWHLYLSGLYTATEIRKIANDDWGFLTRQYKRRDGSPRGKVPLSQSMLYKILNNPFYAGIILHNGQEFRGNHKSMITLDQFDMVQKMLGQKGKPRKGVYDYAYTGLIKCGQCGCSIVGKTVDKKLADGSVKTHVYYHCTRKSEKRVCSQTKYTKLESIEGEIEKELSNYEILPEFLDLALKIIRREHKKEVKFRNSVYTSQHKSRKSIQKQIDELIMMRVNKKISDEHYERTMQQLENELNKTDDNLRHTEARAKDWKSVTEKAFDFATNARTRFAEGDIKVRREILMTLGQEVFLENNQLFIKPSEWLVPIKERYPELEKKYLQARTMQKAVSSDENTALASIFEFWRARRDSTFLRNPAPMVAGQGRLSATGARVRVLF